MKKCKLWIELLFIFLLPLVLMLICIDIKTVNEYDTNNNLIASHKELDLKNINFVNDEEKVYYELSPYLFEISTDIDGNNYTLNFNFYYFQNIMNTELFEYLNSIFDIDSNYCGYTFSTLMDEDCYFMVYGSYDYLDTDETSGLSYVDFYINDYRYKPNTCMLDSLNVDFVFDNYDDYLNFYNLFKDGINLRSTLEFDNSYHIVYSNYVLCSFDSIYTISSNKISLLLNRLFNSLGIVNNVVIQLLVIYTLLWIVMFILWHIVYCPLDWVIHLVSDNWLTKRRDD